MLQDGLARQGIYGLFLSFSMDVFFVVLAALLCRVLCPAAIGEDVDILLPNDVQMFRDPGYALQFSRTLLSVYPYCRGT